MKNASSAAGRHTPEKQQAHTGGILLVQCPFMTTVLGAHTCTYLGITITEGEARDRGGSDVYVGLSGL